MSRPECFGHQTCPNKRAANNCGCIADCIVAYTEGTNGVSTVVVEVEEPVKDYMEATEVYVDWLYTPEGEGYTKYTVGSCGVEQVRYYPATMTRPHYVEVIYKDAIRLAFNINMVYMQREEK